MGRKIPTPRCNKCGREAVACATSDLAHHDDETWLCSHHALTWDGYDDSGDMQFTEGAL